MDDSEIMSEAEMDRKLLEAMFGVESEDGEGSQWDGYMAREVTFFSLPLLDRLKKLSCHVVKVRGNVRREPDGA